MTPLSLIGQKVPSKEAILNIFFDEPLTEDTLRFVVKQNPVSELNELGGIYSSGQTLPLGAAHIRMRIPSPSGLSYFSLSKERSMTKFQPYINLLDDYLIEPGDSIFLTLRRDTSYHPQRHMRTTISGQRIPEILADGTKYTRAYYLDFSGRGSLKFRIRFELDRIFLNHFDYHVLASKARVLLDNNRLALGSRAYELLLADYMVKVFGRYKRLKMQAMWQDAAALSKLLSPETKNQSKSYAGWELERFFTMQDSAVQSPEEKLSKIAKAYPAGLMRDRMLLILLVNNKHHFNKPLEEQTIKQISNNAYRDQLTRAFKNTSRGVKAYNFSLPDTAGRIVNLSDFRGKVVFMDFYFNGCGGCAQYYSRVVSHVKKHFSGDKSVAFVSVSIDKTRESWLAGLRSGLYTSRDAVNLYTAGMGSNHPIIDHYLISGYPTPILIDAGGLIYSDSNYQLRMEGPSGLIQAIKEAKALY